MAKRRDPRKLKDEAQVFVGKGKHKKALEKYLELEAIEEKDGDWPRRAGEQLRSMGKDGEAVVPWTRAVDKYAEAGFLVKAIAVCKMILRADPAHTAAHERLASLNQARGMGPATQPAPAARPSPVVAAPPPVPEPPPISASLPTQAATPPRAIELPPLEATEAAPVQPPRRRTIPPGAALEEISLSASIPGAVESEESDGLVFEIPIDDLDDEFGDIMAPDANPRATTSEALRHTPLFSELSSDSLGRLIMSVDLVELAANEVLFTQGDTGTTLYVVVDGEVAVVAEGPPRVHLSKLGENEFFGEVAVVTNQPRNATIEAIEPTTLLAIERDVFGDLVDDEPSVLKVLLRFLRHRLVDHLVKTSPLFAPFGGGEREKLASRFRFLEVGINAKLIEQGQKSAGLYVILAGQAEVVREENDDTRRLATLGPGDLTGEMSLLSNTEAVATVKTTTKSLILELPASAFREVIMTHPQVLMFIGDVAEERRKKVDGIAAGEADYEEVSLDLI